MTEPSIRDVVRTCPHLSESVHRTEQRREEKNREEQTGKDCVVSPSLVVVDRIYSILDGGLASLDANPYGRPWPLPNRTAIARTLNEHPEDLCLKAAREAREIVQAQDRAPNITALFEKKLRDLLAEQNEHEQVRGAIRESMGEAA